MRSLFLGNKFDSHTQIKKMIFGDLVVVATGPLLRDGGMAEDHGTSEAEQLYTA